MYSKFFLILLNILYFVITHESNQTKGQNYSKPLYRHNTKHNKDKCYVLALEGGGDKGAYQAGALKGLVAHANDTKWDIITGISVGSLNAAAMAIYDLGDEHEATDFLLKQWRLIKGHGDIYQNWWGGPLYGLFAKTSLYDTSPSHKLLDQVIHDSELKRKFVLGATDIKTGIYKTWDEESLTREDFKLAILSSGAYPVVFPLIDFQGETYMDGGVKRSIDIAAGINKCLNMGFREEQIIVDAILLNAKILPQLDPKHVHPLGVLMRVFEVYGYDKAMRDLDDIIEIFPKVHFRYIIEPKKKLPSGSIPLTFSPKDIETMIEIGIEDAKNVVGQGEGVSFRETIAAYRKERYDSFIRRNSEGVRSYPNETENNTSTIRDEEEVTFLV